MPVFALNQDRAPICCVKKPVATARHLSDDAVEALLEPLDRLLALDAVASTDAALDTPALGHALALARHAGVKVHAVDADRGVVLEAEIDVLADAETEVASLGKVPLAKLVFLNLQSTLENLLSLGSADCDMHGNLLVTTDTEGTDGVARLAFGL